MGIEIKGIPQLMKKLNNLVGEEAVMKGIEKGCLRVEATAKEKCKADEGFLRASIDHKLNSGSLSATVFTNVNYAPYKEFGTGIYASKGGGRTTPWVFESRDGKWHTTIGQRAEPFMYPALTSNIDKIKQDIIEAIRNEIGGV